MATKTFTTEQEKKIKNLIALGYHWDKKMSVSAACVVIRKEEDIYFFGLDGEINHNPPYVTIKT